MEYIRNLHALVSNSGITAGAHRLWAHKGYKAKWQAKLILTFFNTIAHHLSIWDWVNYHRVHHKYQDTHADPVIFFFLSRIRP